MNSCLIWFLGLGTSDSKVLQALATKNKNDQKITTRFYGNLIQLIEHPNTDIGNRVIEIVHELFHDEDGLESLEDLEIISELAFNCLNSDLLNLFCGHARKLHGSKMDVEDADDNQAIFQIFEIVEDLLNIFNQAQQDEENIKLFYEKLRISNLFCFLIEMFKQDPKLVKTESWASVLSPGDYANRLYAAELCATIFQLSAIDLKQNKNATIDKLWSSVIEEFSIIEAILVSISVYRTRDPKDADEQEYLFNLFDLLGVLLLNSSMARKSFASEECEGFRLLIMMLKEVNVARIRAIQIIDFVLSPEDASELSVKFINSGGLKVISPILMGNGTGKLIKKYSKIISLSLDQDEGHVCAIFASLFKNIPSESSVYFRLIAKFIENSGEKFHKLIQLHEKYQEKLDKFDKNHLNEEIDEELLLDRINGGLFVLQQIDLCLLILNNSKFILLNVKNNLSETEIENELFDAVLFELEAEKNNFKLKTNILEQVSHTVNHFLNELDNKSTISVLPLLKTFLFIKNENDK